MKKFFFLTVCFLLITLTACSEKEQTIDMNRVSKETMITKKYLEEKGYTLVSFVGKSREVLTKEYLASIRGQQEWKVQPVKPDPFIGKAIQRVTFVVKNHPLNKQYHGEIRVTVFLYQNKVIGGTSFAPENDGAVHSLDGKND
ncbi:hypothetical protein [Falsibacillus albus]|uniref:DUF4830 domain-containing protein n=1 Tax=Falsibacillus albus TaxID=2478915 RepID=A0A3L7JS23_9BACI|nr:hypothetical protein [Falsibacillus albus]RLQ93657.1 hypothetical protein D9X91_16880 [Falsibacillus albus]